MGEFCKKTVFLHGPIPLHPTDIHAINNAIVINININRIAIAIIIFDCTIFVYI